MMGASALADQALVNRAARASRPCGFDPSRKSRSCPSPGLKRKTGPLRSSHLPKGPALSYLAAIPNGCKGHFRSFEEVSLCVRVAPRRRQFFCRGHGYFFFLEVFFATFLVAAFVVFFAFFAMSSSVKN